MSSQLNSPTETGARLVSGEPTAPPLAPGEPQALLPASGRSTVPLLENPSLPENPSPLKRPPQVTIGLQLETQPATLRETATSCPYSA